MLWLNTVPGDKKELPHYGTIKIDNLLDYLIQVLSEEEKDSALYY